MIKKINYNNFLKAQGLFALAQEHYQKAMEYEAALARLLGEEDSYCGCVSDKILDNGTLLDGLKKSGVILPKEIKEVE